MERRRSPLGMGEMGVARREELWGPEVAVHLEQGHHPQPLHHSRLVHIL